MQVEEIFNIWEENKRKTGKFRYLMILTTSPLVEQPIKNLHESTSWFIHVLIHNIDN